MATVVMGVPRKMPTEPFQVTPCVYKYKGTVF